MEIRKDALRTRLIDEPFEDYATRMLEGILNEVRDIAQDQRVLWRQMADRFKPAMTPNIGYLSDHYVPGCDDPGKEPEYLDEHDPPEYLDEDTKAALDHTGAEE